MGMKASNAIATFFKYFVLILVGLIMIYPLLWMISATFKDNSEIFAGIGLWIKNPTLEGYQNALNNFGGSINILQASSTPTAMFCPRSSAPWSPPAWLPTVLAVLISRAARSCSASCWPPSSCPRSS